MDFNELVSASTVTAIEYGPVIMLYSVLALFAGSLGFSSWKAATRREPPAFPWRVYWGVCAVLSWAALLGMLAFTSMDSAVIDEDGTVHENFALLALSTMTGLLSMGLTMTGCIAAGAAALWRRAVVRRTFGSDQNSDSPITPYRG